MTSANKPPFTIFPRALTADDQPYAHTILTVHVAHRAFQTGAFIGLIPGTIRAVRASRAAPSPIPAPSPSSASPSSSPSTVKPTPTPLPTSTHPSTPSPKELLLRTTGRSALITTVFLTAALFPYMAYNVRHTPDASDREYAWRDRAYRLLHNEGQVGTDRGSVVGMGAGAVAVALGGGLRKGVYAAAGRVGVGSLLGVVGWEVWWALGL